MTEPQYVGPITSTLEGWAVGKALYVVPTIKDDYPPALKAALDRRRRAALSGTCDCGAVAEFVRDGEPVARMVVEHAGGCDATTEAIVAIAAEHGVTL